MSADAAAPVAAPELRFRLPGDWWAVDLRDRAAASAAAMRLIRHRIGAQDDRATLRARLHRDLVGAIDEAIRGRGRSMLIAVQIVEAVPLPVAITVYLPELEITPAIGTDPEGVLDILERGLAGAGDPGSAPDATAAPGPTSAPGPGELARVAAAGRPATRSVRVRPVDVGDGDDRGELDVLLVDYWLPVPGSKRVALVSVSSSFAQLREPLVVFFDAIARAAVWTDAAPGEGAAIG